MDTTFEMSTLSTLYVPFRVKATKSGAPFDPTGDALACAFKPGGTEPAVGDFVAGSWEPGGPDASGYYRGRCLVGPAGAIILEEGLWVYWAKITDNPEVVAEKTGVIVRVYRA